MVSVVIPLYNKELQIVQTIKSVLGQTYSDVEVIIVDDGSTDRSVSMINNNFTDSRIRIIHQNNAGVSVARNRGIEESKGDYIAFLDADDEWKPDYLATQISMTKKYPECDVFAVNYEFKNSQGIITPTVIRKISFSGNDGILANYFEVASNSHPPMWTSAILVKKDAIQSIGGFPVGIKAGEDLLTWARLAVSFNIAYSKIPYAIYNVPAKSKTIAKRRMEKDDIVGPELDKLWKTNKSVLGLRQYLSHWYKMRASVAMRHGEIMETIRESIKSIRYNKRNYKTVLYIFVSMLPQKIRAKVISLEK